jgi:uncharacterized protein YbjT (DUF2867 family)
MNVIIFGATGTIGRLAVQQILADGHRVTAFARNPDRLDVNDANVVLCPGDVVEQKAVGDAMTGQDAALVVLGAGTSRRSIVRSEGTRNVIWAMQEQGIRRLICQSTLGAYESRRNLNFFWKYIMFELLLRPILRDHELQETLVRDSGLDWTIVRPGAFVDGPATGAFSVGFGPDKRGLALKISRADVAEFLAQQISGTSFLGRTVAISN